MASERPDLTPADAAVALRSLPRRFRQAIARAAGEDHDAETDPSPDAIEDHAARIGPDGTSPLEQLAATTAELALLRHATSAVLNESTVALHPAVFDRSARDWEVPPGLTVDDGLGLLETEAGALADLIESANATEWAKSGTVAGGRTVTAIGIVSDAVHSAVERLRTIG